MLAVSSSNAAILLVLLLGSLLFHDAAAEWVETAKLVDSDGEAGDGFGYSVAMDNGIMVVGAWKDDVGGAEWAGSATIFEVSDGEWVAQQKLTASEAGNRDFFGVSVAISNGIVAVGAPWDTDRGFQAGAVYVYGKGEDGLWSEQQKLTFGGSEDLFGGRLAMHGNTLIVGATGDFFGNGRVHLFTLFAGTWTRDQELDASGDGFGDAVAIDGETFVVGAPRDDDMGFESGSTYVFQRTGEGGFGLWTQTAKLTPTDGQSLDNFGRTVAIEGGTIFVGSKNNADGENVGAVYQFGEDRRAWTQQAWTQQNKLVARDFEPHALFGYGLAFRNGNLVVGAYGLNSDTGAVYVFQQVSGAWTERAKLVVGTGAADDEFGYAVGVDDDGMVIAGARGDDSDRGSVYVLDWRASVTDGRPSAVPVPTMQPSQHPSHHPAGTSSVLPWIVTSRFPTIGPTTRPSAHPTSRPSTMLTMNPTQDPDVQPTVFLSSFGPSGTPATAASSQPPGNNAPTMLTLNPTQDPDVQPTVFLSTVGPSGTPATAASSQPPGTNAPTSSTLRPTRTRTPDTQPAGGSTDAAMRIGVSVGAVVTVLLFAVLLFAFYVRCKQKREAAASTAATGQDSSLSPSQSDIPRNIEARRDENTLGDSSVGEQPYEVTMGIVSTTEPMRHPVGQEPLSPDGLGSGPFEVATSVLADVHSFAAERSAVAFSEGTSL